MNRYRWLALMMVLGAVVAASFIGMGRAAAGTATVKVYWTGATCIDVQHVYGNIQTVCGGFARFDNPDTGPGYITGVDPIMGLADQISCEFYLNGIMQWSDWAAAGDGTDVNCIREIYRMPGQVGYVI